MEEYDMADHMKVKSSDNEIRSEFPLKAIETGASCESSGTHRLQPGFGFNDNTRKVRYKSTKREYKQLHYQQTSCRYSRSPYKNSKCSGETFPTTNSLSSNARRRTNSLGGLNTERDAHNKDFLNTKYRIYPPARSRVCITNDLDLEIDTIIPMEITETCMKGAPRGLPAKFNRQMTPDCSPLPRKGSIWHQIGLRHNKEPIQKWTIYIPHEYANKPIGDEFGADVWTYQTTQKDGTVYNQHFFVNVKPDGPAAKMKIHDNDEIVLLNAIFVPNVIHAEVLNIFRDVKVDGKTRFKLVLRRLEKVRSKKDWEWVETSAILAPDCRRDLDNYPEVEKPILNTLKGNEYVKKSNHYYKVPGTQSYLDIKQDSVVADVLTNTDADKTKIICRIDHYKFNMETEKFDFTAALFSETVSKYIVVGQEKQIKLDNNPMWFEMTTVRPKIMFKINGLFLACNTETLTIETRASEYMFEEEPVDEVYDHPDHSMPMPCDDKLQFDAEDVKDDSKSTAEHTKMRLEIPENNLFYARRSSEILKTPTTPFNSLFIVN